MWKNRNDLALRQQFRADFRMTPDTFMDTLTLVRNRLEKQHTRFREAFPIEKRIAIASCALWHLATGNSYRSASKTFAVGKLIMANIEISKYFIKFPRTPSGTDKAIATFKKTTNCEIPQAVSAIWAPGTDFS